MIKYNQKRFKNGAIQFRVYAPFATSVIPEIFYMVPYKIIYVQEGSESVHMFDCIMNFLKNLVSVSDIKLSVMFKEQISSAELRYLLSRIVEEVEHLAKSLDKKKVVISSELEGIVDVFVEKDYVFRTRTFLGTKGVKELTLKTHKGNVNEALQNEQI